MRPRLICVQNRFQDPFAEYQERAEKKRTKKAAAEESARLGQPTTKAKDQDDVNWFGEKIGTVNKPSATGIGGGVGKYLQLGNAAPKRPAPSSATSFIAEEPKKKRKVGFGQFEGW